MAYCHADTNVVALVDADWSTYNDDSYRWPNLEPDVTTISHNRDAITHLTDADIYAPVLTDAAHRQPDSHADVGPHAYTLTDVDGNPAFPQPNGDAHVHTDAYMDADVTPTSDGVPHLDIATVLHLWRLDVPRAPAPTDRMASGRRARSRYNMPYTTCDSGGASYETI